MVSDNRSTYIIITKRRIIIKERTIADDEQILILSNSRFCPCCVDGIVIGGSVLKHFQANLDACTEGPLDQRMLLTLHMHLTLNWN